MRRTTLLMLVAVLLAVPAAARAQAGRLEGRVDAATLERLTAVIDGARSDGLPVDALVNKALEGASKRAPGERIVAAVQGLARHLAEARRELGSDATEAELVAGAAALRAGVSPVYLGRLHREQPGRSMVVPLAVMADLVSRGVPADTAARAVVELARAGAREEELVAFRQSVERDIALGAPAGAAATVRVSTAGGRAASTTSDAQVQPPLPRYRRP